LASIARPHRRGRPMQAAQACGWMEGSGHQAQRMARSFMIHSRACPVRSIAIVGAHRQIKSRENRSSVRRVYLMPLEDADAGRWRAPDTQEAGAKTSVGRLAARRPEPKGRPRPYPGTVGTRTIIRGATRASRPRNMSTCEVRGHWRRHSMGMPLARLSPLRNDVKRCEPWSAWRSEKY
jgi:hypothetical protein